MRKQKYRVNSEVVVFSTLCLKKHCTYGNIFTLLIESRYRYPILKTFILFSYFSLVTISYSYTTSILPLTKQRDFFRKYIFFHLHIAVQKDDMLSSRSQKVLHRIVRITFLRIVPETFLDYHFRSECIFHYYPQYNI